ncbi:hypothetical protein M441DRAFT_218728 [Trichoderma asperellum CBS 433.97]|uniref:Uncharacterized protein n=1 Tax=Trichoderma asperellum (strain ATCC 204424 / CBS 433.97 / NBRC 101777) TaxID=1042311 RepID=A0A2T3ZNY2_TRIA4|nr:hypothetical protein M441DRAFT_218728 [Trichoderma asperellum CBS 433.97]PTB46521.1 hypothetical protein M441DRAFT_218728 [Trichoderma asperellum CBS 433.97]
MCLCLHIAMLPYAVTHLYNPLPLFSTHKDANKHAANTALCNSSLASSSPFIPSEIQWIKRCRLCHLPSLQGRWLLTLAGMAMYISLMVHARSLAAKSESHNTQEVLQSGLRNSLRRASLKILSYLLDNAADASIVNPKLFYLFYFSSSYAENNII